MQHVDDGTLHAYLDQELDQDERTRVTQHLDACPACRDRLSEARALVTRSAQVLAKAAPPRPLREASLATTRRRRWRGVRVPLAWAATLVIAFALGRYAEGRRTVEDVAQTPIGANDGGTRTAPASGPRPVPRTTARAPAPASRPTPAPISAPAAQAPSAGAQSQAAPARRRLEMDRLDFYADEAARVLGQAPAALPGLPIVRSTVGADGQAMIEQELASGTVIRLYERRAAPATNAAPSPFPPAEPKASARAPAAARDAREEAPAERLARYVGPLRVEISGPLEIDSLEKLLELVR